MSLEDASKRLEVAFKDTENRLDAVGKKVDSALVGLTDHQKGSDAISAHSLENNASATELLKEVHEVKEEFKNIVDLADNLKKDHDEFMSNILQELKHASLAAETLKSFVPEESKNSKVSEPIPKTQITTKGKKK